MTYDIGALEPERQSEWSLAYVKNTSASMSHIDWDSLEQQYPGWYDRFVTMITLDLPRSEWLNYLFAPQPALHPVASLPDSLTCP